MICKKCGAEKAQAEFYLSNRTRCKDCVRDAVKIRARSNPAVQAYERERSKRPARKAHIASVAINWRMKNPAAYKAHYTVSNAIRDGKMKKGVCEVCGSEKVHAHHEDYAKPLEVRWLCALHHHRLHADDPSAEGKNKGMKPAA